MQALVQKTLASTRALSESPTETKPALLGAQLRETPHSIGSSSQATQVDIIVPIHNAARELRDCLDALAENTDLPSHLILVDDHSNDSQIEEILSSLPNKFHGTSIHALTIVRLSRNAGFSGSVNLGIAVGTSPYVVLLNSDTIPPPQWLSRLIAPLITDSSIGSVTPLSNSATICSFRSPYESEQDFDPIAFLRTDSLFARHGSKEPITIPTGVGFCFASRRSVYDQIGFLDADLFRKMYGEECDWCMRVIGAGLRNVAITNLFVPHVDGASAKDANVNRQQLLARCTVKLRTLHPDFYPSIDEFVRRDPLEPIRNFMHLVLLGERERPAATLYVHNPELAGGSSRYLDQLLARQSREGEALILAATSQETFLQHSLHESQERIAISAYMGDDTRFRELLAAFNIQEIVVNQMVGSAYDALTERIRNSGVPYTVHLHDFFFACPTITLIGHTGRYCGGETRVSECSACLHASFEKSPDTNNLSITAWREHSYEFLCNASAVVAVSEHTRNIYRRYFPDLAIRVEEPLLESSPPMRTLNNSILALPILNVAVIGSIGKHKGSDLIYEIVDTLRNRALPIKLVVCGTTDRHSEPYIDRNGFFEVTGRYEPSELPKLLARHRIAFTLLPSIWPETFLYTASESMACGYPVMVSGLTAAAHRVSEREAGWVLEDLTATGIIAELERLFYNRQEITEKTKNLLFAESAAADPSAPIVIASQHPFKEFLVEL
jgi:GT2 family glycosyltransferase/glycosyltransferase involved in cell wall biosynthesis